MSKWLLAALLVLEAHFAASYIVPLNREAQGTFGGLLRWAWPWALGDGGLLDRITTSGFSVAEFFLAVTTAGVFMLAALAVMGWWVPFWPVEGAGYRRSYTVALLDGRLLRTYKTAADGA